MINNAVIAENIVRLAKANGIKIGDLEERIGVSRGYLSRMAKPDYPGSPSIEALEQAASLLGVTIDYLLHFTNSLSVNETYIVRFIDSVSSMTTTGKIDWARQLKGVLQNGNRTIVNNWFLETDPYEPPEDNVHYQSHFYSGHAYFSGDSYHGELMVDESKQTVTMYLNKVSYYLKDNAETVNSIIEIYIFIGDKVRPVCSSYYTSAEVTKRVNELYNTVSAASSGLFLESDTKRMMFNFVNLCTQEMKKSEDKGEDTVTEAEEVEEVEVVNDETDDLPYETVI